MRPVFVLCLSLSLGTQWDDFTACFLARFLFHSSHTRTGSDAHQKNGSQEKYNEECQWTPI